MSAAKLSHAETVNTDWVSFSLCKMYLLVFCADNRRAQKRSSSDWLNPIFVCDQHECWPLPSWLIFASPRKFMERSRSSTDFLCACVCLRVPACAWGHLPPAEPTDRLARPTTALVSRLWESGPTYTNSNKVKPGKRAHHFLFAKCLCSPSFPLAIAPYLALKFCSDTSLAWGNGSMQSIWLCITEGLKCD